MSFGVNKIKQNDFKKLYWDTEIIIFNLGSAVRKCFNWYF